MVFAGLATINSGGYRYGVSDQAFYAAAVAKHLRPELFPRDTPLIDAQARLMLADEAVGSAAVLVGADLPSIHLVFYALTLVTLFAAALLYGRALGFSLWASAAFLGLLTFRHQITRTGANTLEGYMHPRQLAFALGVIALAGLVRGRVLWAAGPLILAAILHTTTAVWFGMALVVAVVWTQPNRGRWLAIGGGAAAAAVLWAVLAGPISGRLVRMDPAWLAVLSEKSYLFPAAWPLYAWIINLAYPVVIGLAYRSRRARGVRAPREGALVAGLMALVGVFLVCVPFTAVPIALAVQLQVNRVFWLLDCVALGYAAWWLTGLPRRAAFRTAIVALIVLTSFARGLFVLQHADRRVIAASLPDTPWVEAMNWLKRQPVSWHVLADPGHAWRYGVSVRLAAERDVLLESGKDSALAIYDRGIAMRVAERSAALQDFDRFTTADVRALATRYGLDVFVVEEPRSFDLPVLYRNSQFVVYDLR